MSAKNINFKNAPFQLSLSSGEVANASFKTGGKSYFMGNLNAFYRYATPSNKFKILYHIFRFKKKGSQQLLY